MVIRARPAGQVPGRFEAERHARFPVFFAARCAWSSCVIGLFQEKKNPRGALVYVY